MAQDRTYPHEPTEQVPGFVTVWRAEDAGLAQEVTCPRCDTVFGSVGERSETELLCRKCQTVYRVRGTAGGTPTVEALGRRILVDEGDGRLGDALRGRRPKDWTFSTGDYVLHVILIIALFVALAISMAH